MEKVKKIEGRKSKKTIGPFLIVSKRPVWTNFNYSFSFSGSDLRAST